VNPTRGNGLIQRDGIQQPLPPSEETRDKTGALTREELGMHFREISETGSYARFFVQMIAMYLIATALAFCLITAAYV
jgi:hypothetical protein